MKNLKVAGPRFEEDTIEYVTEEASVHTSRHSPNKQYEISTGNRYFMKASR
jgi:hypothetical protein